jgi:glycosyltransferase involved in cell wall biosynthesis
MKKLSAIIITFNEERNIARCLNSLKDIADEIVVIDSGSTDATVAICKQFNAKVIIHEFKGFIEQKNFAYLHTTGDWVLLLDADEEASETMKASIVAELKNPKHDGYSFNRLTYYCGKWIRSCGWYPDAKLRLFKRGAGEWAGQNPHDKLTLLKNKTSSYLKGDILHYRYYSFTEHIHRANKYANIAAEIMFKKGKTISLFGIIIKTNARFIKCYILNKGIFDGIQGLMISTISALEVFIKYSKLLLLNSKNKDEEGFYK